MFRVLSLALVACLLMAGSAFADMKIGVFNSQAVAMDSDAAKAAQQKLQSQFGAEKTQLEKQAKDLQSKGEALQAQVAKMSAKEREDKQMEFLRLRRAKESHDAEQHDYGHQYDGERCDVSFSGFVPEGEDAREERGV